LSKSYHGDECVRCFVVQRNTNGVSLVSLILLLVLFCSVKNVSQMRWILDCRVRHDGLKIPTYSTAVSLALDNDDDEKPCHDRKAIKMRGAPHPR
jgi:hypothetical protein